MAAIFAAAPRKAFVQSLSSARKNMRSMCKDKLYDDNDLNCDNFAQAVREYRCSREVITATANLYLRQQIMIDTY